MSETWVNFYGPNSPTGIEHGYAHESPDACADSAVDDWLIRVEHRYNGHWFRPPVGMQAEPCPHLFGPFGDPQSIVCMWCELELCDDSEGA